MFEPLEATVNLVNQNMQLSGATGSSPAIVIDYGPPIGDGLRHTPLELILMSLAACSGSTVALLLRRMRKDVSGLTVHARGIRREQNPTYFTTITLEFVLISTDVGPQDIERTMRMSEETFCPVWAMLKNSVKIVTEYSILRPEQAERCPDGGDAGIAEPLK